MVYCYWKPCVPTKFVMTFFSQYTEKFTSVFFYNTQLFFLSCYLDLVVSLLEVTVRDTSLTTVILKLVLPTMIRVPSSNFLFDLTLLKWFHLCRLLFLDLNNVFNVRYKSHLFCYMNHLAFYTLKNEDDPDEI
jgi:hypothetical protein